MIEEIEFFVHPSGDPFHAIFCLRDITSFEF